MLGMVRGKLWGEGKGGGGGGGEEEWVVVCNDPLTNGRRLRCASNQVLSTKYTPLSFLPKALFEQLGRVANLYFLLVAAVSCTRISPSSPAPHIGPLLLVLALSLAREAVEDVRRARSDRALNTRSVEVLRVQERVWALAEWQAVAVGDLVRVREGHVFPADLLLLASSNAGGVCYVSTAGVDGETNLKLRRACGQEGGQDVLGSAEAAAALRARVVCDPPQRSCPTHLFSGTLLFPDGLGVPAPVAASSEQLLLRGCSLRHTECVVGVAVFAGWQTRVMMMSAPPLRPSKRSSLEGRLHRLLLLLCALLLLLCAVAGMGYGYALRPEEVIYLRCTHADSEDYLGRMDDYSNRSTAAVLAVFTFFVLLSPIIPISLYVAVELARFAHCTYFICNDRRMCDKGTGAVARTSDSCEDLGRVEYVFSDKTGTLTCNSMEFVKCSIAGVVYGGGSAAEEKGCSFQDPRLMGGAWRNGADPLACLHFFRCLAICHTVLPQGPPDDPRTTTYLASSPDEAALVGAAKKFGFVFHHRGPTSVRVLEQHVEQVGMARDVEYSILNVLEFDSSRKMQSLVCRHPDGKLLLYCKGADNVIFARMSGAGNEHGATAWEHLERFGAEGLRTLCLAYRELDVREYECWNAMYVRARAVGQELRVADLMERNLVLLGCTAVEDKLQEGVRACIRSLCAAGIKVWMLTGDKTETAMNVAYACGLLDNGTRQLVINAEAAGMGMGKGKEGGLDRVVKELLREGLLEAQSTPDHPIALVIDGECLALALEDGREVLLALALRCRPVLCCRVSPSQKALLTLLVREGAGKVTLSIGDGANDVGMIQAAHVGVGISSQQVGLHTVMASDFTVAQFRFLADLLLVHGRWSYLRITKVISYSLYKNLAFALTQFWFTCHSLFSGQQLYDDWYVSLFTLLFTTFPVLVVGTLDQDVGATTARQHPQLYRPGIRNACFTWTSLGLWFASAFYHSLILFYLPLLVGTSAQTGAGLMFGTWDISTLAFTCLVTTVNLRLLMASSHLTMWHCTGVAASIAAWVMLALLYGRVKSWYDTWNVYGVIFILLGTWYFWLCLLLVPAAALALDFLVHALRRSFYPLDYHILQELVKFPRHVAAAKRAARKGTTSHKRKSKALERRKTLEMRKSIVAQKRKTSIQIVRRRGTLEEPPSVLPWQAHLPQIQTDIGAAAAAAAFQQQPVDTTSLDDHTMHKRDVWPPSGSMAVYSSDPPSLGSATGAWQPAQIGHQNQMIPFGPPNPAWEQVDRSQQRNWAPPASSIEAGQQADHRHPYRSWQRADSFKPDNYWVASDTPDGICPETSQPYNSVGYVAQNGVYERVSGVYPTSWAPHGGENRRWLGADVAQPNNNWVPYNTPNGDWQGGETSGSGNWVPYPAQSGIASQMSNRYSYGSPDLVSQQGSGTGHSSNWVSHGAPVEQLYDTSEPNDMVFYGPPKASPDEVWKQNATGTIQGAGSYQSEGAYPANIIRSGTDMDSSTERRRKSMAIVSRGITKELQNRGSILETIGTLRTQLGLDMTTSPIPELEKRSQSLELARRSIDRELIRIRKSIHAVRKSRVGFHMFTQENKSPTPPTMPRYMTGEVKPIMSRRAQASVTQLLGHMSRRHTGFAFENPISGQGSGQ